MSKVCYIMVGIPGAGKSSWIKDNCPDALVCSADHYHMVNGVYRFDGANLNKAHQASMRKFVDGCVRGVDKIVSDNTNVTLDQISPYYAVAKAYDYNVKVIWLNVDPLTASKRNTHGVSEETCKRMATSLYRLIIPPFWQVEIIKDGQGTRVYTLLNSSGTVVKPV